MVNFRVRQLIVLFVSVIIFNSLGFAQEGDNPGLSESDLKRLSKVSKIEIVERRKVGEMAFAVFAYRQPAEDYYYYRDGKLETVRFNTGSIRTFQYGKFTETIVFYRKFVDEEGKETFLPVAETKLKSGQYDGIVVLNPLKGQVKPNQIQRAPFVDLSPRSFQTSDIRLVNFTNKKLMVKLDEKVAALAPLENVVTKFKSDSRVFPLKLGVNNNGKRDIIYSNMFQHSPGRRVLFIIVPDFGNTNASTPIRCLIYKDAGAVTG